VCMYVYLYGKDVFIAFRRVTRDRASTAFGSIAIRVYRAIF